MDLWSNQLCSFSLTSVFVPDYAELINQAIENVIMGKQNREKEHLSLRTVIHGNGIARQSGSGDQMDDWEQNKTQNVGGPGS